MGKGGTKFVGEAVNVRSGRQSSTYTSKELKKNMDKFLETGVHPDLQRAQAAPSGILYPLPDPDPTRPYVFLDLTLDNRPLGRVVIELYEDVVPAAARHLLNRCLPGASASLLGATVHKLLPHYGLFAGKSPAAQLGAGCIPAHHRLQHNVAGAVSVSRNGAEFAISLGKAMVLDETHQVVGRVAIGSEHLEVLNDVPRSPDDTPLMRIKVSKCGATNAQGTHESLDESLAKETPEQAAARLKQQSADTRSAVMEALQEGMSHKRSADAAGLEAAGDAAGADPGSAAAAAAGTGGAGSSRAAAAAAPAAAPNKRSKLLDSLLDDLDGEDDSSSSGGSGGSSDASGS